MGQVLLAGSAAALFAIALIALLAYNERLAALAVVAGLFALSLAMLAHLNDLPPR